MPFKGGRDSDAGYAKTSPREGQGASNRWEMGNNFESRRVPLALEMEEGRRSTASNDTSPRGAAGDSASAAVTSRCCPVDICCCCPAGRLRDLIPSPFRRIQGWTHLLLLLGVLSCVVLVCFDLESMLSQMRKRQAQKHLPEDILGVLFMTPCIVYFVRTIRQYDQDLSQKKIEVEHQRERLIEDFKETLGSMDNFLNETTQTNLGFAERGFETKRRDFQHFLDRAKACYGASQVVAATDASPLLRELRRFCLNWFSVFAECSIDPVHAPRQIANRWELEVCDTIEALCDLCLDRLKAAEVRFISSQKEQDAKLCDDTRGAFHRMTVRGSVIAKPHFGGGSVMGARCCKCWCCSWVICGCSAHVLDERMQEHKEQTGYPKVCSFLCGRLVFLSREHVILILGFLVGCLLVTLDILLGDVRIRILVTLGPCLFCIVVVLVKFEDIDIVQQLQRECFELAAEKVRVQNQHERMKDFWIKAQQLTDLWLYRTIPRLNLYSEIQGFMEDMPPHQLHQSLKGVNNHLEEFDGKLPRLEAWRNDGDLAESLKKQFRDAVGQVCRERGLDGILGALGKLSLPWG